MNSLLFRRISGNLSKTGDSIASAFHHRIKVGDSLICPNDSLKVVNNKFNAPSNEEVEETVYFVAKSSKFERFYVSYIFKKPGTYMFDVVKATEPCSEKAFSSKGEHEEEIKVTVRVFD